MCVIAFYLYADLKGFLFKSMQIYDLKYITATFLIRIDKKVFFELKKNTQVRYIEYVFSFYIMYLVYIPYNKAVITYLYGLNSVDL